MRNFAGEITIINSTLSQNFIGIQVTTTNAASSSNKTIENLRITNNSIFNSTWHGIKIDLTSSGVITIQNNTLDNTDVPDIGPDTQNGRFGIRIKNHPSPYIDGNTIRNFGRSGIQLQSITNITAVNNYLYNNGSQDYSITNGEITHYAAGIQALDSTFSNISYNTIISNRHSGIAAYSTGGTIGPDNTIKFDGNPNLLGGGSGGLQDCVVIAGGPGSFRGGIMVRGLEPDEEMTVMCTNTITSNYYKDVIKTGEGTVYNCGFAISPFFATADDTVYYYDGSSGHVVHDCNNSTINAATDKPSLGPRPFGIIIAGIDSDVTVQNCSIMNAAMEKRYAATTGNGTLVGAGIFIANDATPYITNNFIFSNGWGVLDDRIYTEAGASGIQMRCAETQTSIINNIIVSNANDGLVGRETGGLIGVVNQGNTFRNNGRGAIGIYDGMNDRDLTIAYNEIHDNQRGIGLIEYEGTTLNISDNIIYSNQGNYSVGGIGIKSSDGTVSVTNNTVRNNLDSGIGLLDFTGSAQIYSNEIYKNGPSDYIPPEGVGGIAGVVLRAAGTGVTLRNNNISINNGDGVSAKESSPVIGESDAGNSFINNIRMGVGVSGSGNPLIGYNYIFSNTNGGVGAYSITNSVVIFSNYIHSNFGEDNPGGIGLMYLNGGTLSIRNNTIDDNISDQVNNVPWGIGIGEPDSGNVVINNNVIASNGREQGATLVGGIGIQGTSLGEPGTLDNLDITSNRISNHGKKRAAIAFQWLYGTINIRNNKKDGLGLYANAEGIRFQEMAPGAIINIENNLFVSNENQFAAGGVGVQFRNCSFVNVDVDNNIFSANTWKDDGAGKAVVSFEYCRQYSTNSIKLRRNTIKNTNNQGIIVRDVAGAGGIDISYISISSNDIFSNGGGVGMLDLTDAKVNMQGNTIKNNASVNAVGIGLSATNGTFSFMNNMVFSNDNQGSGPGGMGFYDVAASASVRVEGNSVYNNDGWKTAGLGISNTNATVYTDFTIYSNFILRNGIGGLGIWNASLVNIQNNKIFSNGWSGMQIGDEIYGSGIQVRRASFVNNNIVNNTIRSNWFAGIAAYSTVGSIGENNTIIYNGIYSPSYSGGGGGGLEDCEMAAGAAGDIRGGILARGMNSSDELTVACTNDVFSNYHEELAKTGGGILRSCANIITSFFASDADTVFYFDESSGTVDLDCSDYDTWSLDNATIDASVGDRKFGIIIVGAGSDVTVRNCTIKNAAMNEANRATVVNNDGTRYIGAGIFITNNAAPKIYSNYIFSNGWDILDDRIYTEAGASGIQMRCGAAATSIYNNVIASNRNDGLIGRETGGLIGLVNLGNTFRNNGRGGIGFYDGTTRNLEIVYNTIHNNQRGIGMVDFDGNILTIANNVIYSNQGDLSVSGIGFNNLSAPVSISNNNIRNNKAANVGGIGLKSGTGSIYIIDNDLLANSYTVATADLYQPGAIGIGGISGIFTGTVNISGNSIENNTGYNAPGGIGIGEGYDGDCFIYSNYITRNDSNNQGAAYSDVPGGIGIYIPAGGSITIDNNFIHSNIVHNNSYIGGVGIRGGGQSSQSTLQNIIIVSNRISQHRQGVAYPPSNAAAVGIEYIDFSGGDIIIRNNKKDGVGIFDSLYGIEMKENWCSDTNYGNIIIENNILNSFAREPAGALFYSSGIRAIYNKFANFYIRNNTIENASSYNNGDYGIEIAPYMPGGCCPGGWRATKLIEITGNSISNIGQTGIQLEYFNDAIPPTGLKNPSTSIHNNIIYSCGLKGVEDDASGIAMRHMRNVRMWGNTIRNNAQRGVSMLDVDAIIGSSDPAGRNYLYGNGWDGSLNDKLGLGVYNSTSSYGVSLFNNDLFSNFDAGIGLNNTAYVTIENLAVYSNGDGDKRVVGVSKPDAGIRINTSDVTMLNNIIRNNDGFGIAVSDNLAGETVIISGNTIGGASARGNSFGGVGIGVDDAANNQGTFYIDDRSGVANIISHNGSNTANVGGVGISNLSLANVSLANNRIYSNIGAIGGIGVTVSNGTLSLVNNEVISNIGSSFDVNLRNVGGIGFNSADAGTTIYLDGNTLENNRALVIGGLERGRVGAFGISNSNATITLTNNTLVNNNALCIGGAGFDLFSGTAYISSNMIYSNSNSNNDWGAGGLAFDEAGGNITITHNTIYSNANMLSGSGGVGINQLLASATVLLENNAIYNNDGGRGAGIGILSAANGSAISLINNSIHNNNSIFAGGIALNDSEGVYYLELNTINNNTGTGSGGIAVTASNLTIFADSNLIYSNDSSGFSFYQTTNSNITITGSTIRNNDLAGIRMWYGDNVDLSINNNSISNHERSVRFQDIVNGTIIIDGNDYLGNNSNGGITGHYSDALTISITGNTIANCSWAGVQLSNNEGPGNIVVGNNSIYSNGGSSYAGLNMQMSGGSTSLNEVLIYSNDFRNNGTGGIRMQSTTIEGGITLRNNTIANNFDTGFGLQTMNLSLLNVVGNYFDNNGPGNYGGGIGIWNNTSIIDITFDNNTIKNHTNGSYPVGVRMQNNNSLSNIVFIDNFIKSNNKGITGQDSCASLRIVDNTITNHGDTGIEYSNAAVNGDISISNNNLSQNQGGALSTMSMSASTFAVINNDARNITPSGSAYGIGFSSPSVTTLVVADNEVNSHSNNNLGISSGSATHVTIANNSFNNSNVAGVGIWSLGGIEDFTIFSNYADDNSDAGFEMGSIFASGSVNIANNTAVNNNNIGFAFQSSGSAAIMVKNNKAANNGDGGIALQSTGGSPSSITVKDNFVVSNTKGGLNYSGVQLYGFNVADNINVESNTIRNNGGSGLRMQNITGGDIFIKDNIVFSHNEAGCGFSTVTMDSMLFSGNDVTNNGGSYGYSQSGGMGIYDLGVTTVNIKANTFTNNTATGINPGGLGISVADSFSVVSITNNLIDNNIGSPGGCGISISGGTFYIGENTVYSNDGSGLGIYSIGNIKISGSSISNNKKSGISITLCNSISMQNNIIYSNGLENTTTGDFQDASGVRVKDSTFSNVRDNTIRNNLFAGIASYGTPGIIGPDNVIIFDGDSAGDPGGGGGSMENCVISGGGAGTVRGGILVRDLDPTEEMTVMCTNDIHSNYYKDVAKTGGGTVYSCGNALTAFFASAADTVYWFEGPTTYNLNCNQSASNIIDASGKPFGIVILGSDADVTVQNCTIKNAAMDTSSWADTGDGSNIGAAIFISNNATPSITNNYIYSNGWGVLQDGVVGSASAGILMRCAETQASIFNNIIASNANDGLVGRETGGLIGVISKGNTFRNNGRGGISFYDGTTRNLEVVYNAIHNNKRGIGTIDFDGTMLNITNNVIYSNQGNSTTDGGIGLLNFSGTVQIDNNVIVSNQGIGIGLDLLAGTVSVTNSRIANNDASGKSKPGGIGISNPNGGTLLIQDNKLYSNIGGIGALFGSIDVGGIGFGGTSGSYDTVDATIFSNEFYQLQQAVSFNHIDNGSLTIKNNHIHNNYDAIRDLSDLAYMELENNIITTNDHAGVTLTFVADLVARGNTIGNNGLVSQHCSSMDIGGGLILYSTGVTECKSNSVFNNYCAGIASYGSSGTIGGPSGEENYVYGNGTVTQPDGSGKHSGIVVGSGSMVIAGNFIFSNMTDGIGLREYANNVTVGNASRPNTIYNNKRYGVGIDTGNHIVENNVIYSNDMTGIAATNVSTISLSDNRLYSNGSVGNVKPAGIGITLSNGSINISDNTIENNISSNAGAIGIGSSGNVIVTNNLIFTNTGNSAIGALGNSQLTVGNNTIRNNNGLGIGFGEGTPAFSGVALIENNKIYQNQGIDYVGGAGESFCDPCGPSTGVGGIGGYSMVNASISIINNEIYSHDIYSRSSIGFRDPSNSGNTDNIYIYSNWMPDSRDEYLALVISNGTSNVINSNSTTVKIDKNYIRQWMQFLRINEVEISNNDIQAVEYPQYFMAPGVITVEHQYAPASGANHTAMIHDNIIDMKNVGLKGIMIRSDFSGIGAFAQIYSNTIRNTDDYENVGGYAHYGTAITHGFADAGGIKKTEGFIRNNLIYSTYNGMQVRNGQDFEISNNTIFNQRWGIRARWPWSTGGGKFKIKDNVVYSCGTGAASEDSTQPDAGISAWITNTTVDLEITSNKVWDINGKGIAVGDPYQTTTVSVSNNTIWSNQFQGISARQFNFTLTNQGDIYILGNTVKNNERSGINFSVSNKVTVQNNFIVSNGLSDIFEDGKHDASGIRAKDANLNVVSGNTIRNNKFSGVSSYSSPGIIGPDNVIEHDGLQSSDPAGGDLVDCVMSGGGDIRGGVLVRNLGPSEEMTVMCTNTIENNYWNDVAKTGAGTLYSCGNVVSGFFASADDAVYWLEGPTTYNLNCSAGEIDAAGKAFGVVILGSDADVTVQNCTIKNAAMSESSRATTGNGSIIGAGIFISNNAAPSISNNYIFSNGWGILDDGVVTSASAGIMMRCAEATTSIVNNVIASNLNDGLVARESGGFIGITNHANTFRNNGRGGIGINDGTTRNLEIVYNTIHNNKRGIGAVDFDGAMFTIANNYIYSNQGNNTYRGGGIRFNNLTGSVKIDSNLIDDNIDTVVGGIGFTLGNGNISIVNNTIRNNAGTVSIGEGAGGIGFSSGTNDVIVDNNKIYSNTGTTGIGIVGGNQLTITNNNTIRNNSGVGIGFGTASPAFTGYALIDGNTIQNNDGDQTGQFGAGGIGGYGVTGAISIVNNYIHYHIGGTNNEKSGVGFSLSNFSGPLNIVNNTMVSNDAGSIGFESNSGDINIYSNTLLDGVALRNNTAGNINISANNITGDGVRTAPMAKVFATVLANDNDRVSIINNTIDGNQQGYNGIMGVCKDAQNGFEISGNTLQNALKNGMAMGFVHGDVNDGKVSGSIHDNYLQGNRWRGIILFNPVGISVFNNTIYNNGEGNWTRSVGCGCHGAHSPSEPDSNAPDTGIAMSKWSRTNVMSAHIYSNIIYSNNACGINLSKRSSSNYNPSSSFSIFNNTIGSSQGGNAYFGIGVSGYPEGLTLNLDVFGNTIVNNDDTGIGMDTFSGTARIQNNYIHNNQSSAWEFSGGIGLYGGAPTISIMNNTILSNKSTASGPGGIGFNSLTASASARIEGNSIFNNSGWIAGGVGITDSGGAYYIGADNTVFRNDGSGIAVNNIDSVEIYGSTITNNQKSGISCSLSNAITIQNNFVVSNGLDDYLVNGLADASGVRARDSFFAEVTGNIIRNNLFAGIASYGTDGYIGPDNTIQNNGNSGGESGGCMITNGPGSGDGGIAVRDLEVLDTLVVSDNVIENNNKGLLTRKDCNGTVRLNGENLACTGGYWDESDVGTLINESNVTIDNMVFSQENVWGIVVMGDVDNVSIMNSTIHDNCIFTNSKGRYGESAGGGILIANGASVYVYNNSIYNNGATVQNYGVGGDAGLVVRCTASDSLIISNAINYNANDGVALMDASGIIGEVGLGNSINNNGRFGVGASSATGYGDAIIAYNYIHDNSDKGIGISRAGEVSILNNEIHDNTNQGIGFGGGTMNSGTVGATTNNSVILGSGGDYDDLYNDMVLQTTGTPEYCLIVDYDGATHQATINQNWITGPSSGSYSVYTTNMAYAYVKDNDIYSNAVGVGIAYAAPGSDIRIYSNTIYDNSNSSIGPAGVGVSYAQPGAIVSVNYNTITNSRWTAATNGPGGLGIKDSSGWIRVSNNYFANPDNSQLSGGAVGIADILVRAEILVDNNLFSGFNGDNAANGIGDLGVENIHHDAFVKVDGNRFYNNYSDTATDAVRYAGIRQTTSYTGQFGYVGVYNNIFSGNTGGDSGTGQAVGFGGASSSNPMNLAGRYSMIDITGNTIYDSPCAGVRFRYIDGTSSANPINSWVYVRENSFKAVGSAKDCRSIQWGGVGNDAAPATNFVNVHIQNNRPCPNGISWGGSAEGPGANGELWITGNDMYDALDSYTKDELVVWDDDNEMYEYVTFSNSRNNRTTFIFSGNRARDNTDGDVMWWAGHSPAWYKVDVYWDSNIYSNIGRGHGWEHENPLNMYHRNNTCKNMAYKSTSGKLSVGGLGLAMIGFSGTNLYYIGNYGDNLYYNLIGVEGSKGYFDGDKLVVANNYAVNCGQTGIGFGGADKSTSGFTTAYIYGNTVANVGYNASGVGIGFQNVSGGPYTFRNNIIMDDGSQSGTWLAGLSSDTADANFYYNTIVGINGNALSSNTASATLVAKANLLFNNTTDYQNIDTKEYNADSGSGCTNCTDISSEAESDIFVTVGDHGARIKNHASIVNKAGTDSFGTVVDIDNHDRLSGTDYDMGADEYNSSGNHAPTISNFSCVQVDSQLVSMSYTGTDPDNNEIYYKYDGTQYTPDGGINWLALEDMTLWSSGNNTFSSGGTSHTVYWNVAKDLPNVENSSAKVRLQANDWFQDSNQTTCNTFTIDTKLPRNLANLQQTDASSSSVSLSWTPAEDGNFLTYEILYSSGSNKTIDRNCSGCVVLDKDTSGYVGANLGSAGTSSTEITGLNSSTTYSVNIFAVDAFGNYIECHKKSADAQTTP